MKNTQIKFTVLAAIIVAAAFVPQAVAQGSMAAIHGAQYSGPEAIAKAILEPVGAEDGWGRVAVSDRTDDGLLERRAVILAFGLDPQTAYSAVIDGQLLAEFTTDAAGSAEIVLAPEAPAGPVPEAIPPTDQLMEALIVDASDAAVLQGSFEFFTPHSGGGQAVEYRETIPLLDVTGGFAQGMARVERFTDETESFESRAVGLAPGAQYRIVVDGAEIAVTTADSMGYAGIELSSAEGSDEPLPASMQPVDEVGTVEWQALEGGETILAGSFTGEPNGDNGGDDHGDPGDGDHGAMGESIRGRIAGLLDAGFILQAGMAVVSVQVTAETSFENFTDLSELQIGVMVEVEGTIDGTQVIASRIELIGNGDDDGSDDHGGGSGDDGGSGDQMATVMGMIVAWTPEGFILQDGMNSIEVIVDDGTVFENFTSLVELEIGTSVEVTGTLDGSELVAVSIEILGGGGDDGGSGDDGGDHDGDGGDHDGGSDGDGWDGWF